MSAPQASHAIRTASPVAITLECLDWHRWSVLVPQDGRCLRSSSGSIWLRELANTIFEYLKIFHNRQRRHSAAGMLSPVEFEARQRPTTAA